MDWRALNRRFVVPQRGVLGAWQAIEAGVPERTLFRHLDIHGWTALGNGVWVAPASPPSYERDCWAALVAVRLRAVLTAESSLHLAGAVPQRPERVTLWVRPRYHVQGLEGARHHRGRWVAGDRLERRAGLPCASVQRSFCDYAADHGVPALVKAAAALHRLRVSLPAETMAYIEGRGRFPGKRRALQALSEVTGELSHSRDEQLARRLLRAADLSFRLHPAPLTIVHRGLLLGEIDLPFPDVRYGVEVDGPHHLLPAVVAADKARDRRLRRRAGWIVDRFPADEIRRDPGGFVRQVRAGLEAAARQASRDWRNLPV